MNFRVLVDKKKSIHLSLPDSEPMENAAVSCLHQLIVYRIHLKCDFNNKNSKTTTSHRITAWTPVAFGPTHRTLSLSKTHSFHSMRVDLLPNMTKQLGGSNVVQCFEEIAQRD